MIRQRALYPSAFIMLAFTVFASLFAVLSWNVHAEEVNNQRVVSVEPHDEQPASLVGAACVIRHGKQMVMVSEVITQKLSIPGGYIDSQDTASEAARREALEETGLDVDVIKLLQFRGRAAIFACVTTQPILVAEQEESDQRQQIAAWQAVDFSREVKAVYLMSPLSLASAEYRYPEDTAYLYQWMMETPESEVVFYTDISDRASAFHQAELIVIKAFKDWGNALPDVAKSVLDSLMWLLNLSGEYWFVFLLIAVIASLFGPTAMLQLLAATVITILVSTCLKQVFNLPRPFYLVPALQNGNAYGFSFPSGHTLLATVIWGMFWMKLCAGKSRFRAGAGLLVVSALILGQALARVWFGVHFISDTVAAIVIGILLLILFSRLITPTAIRGKSVWLGITVLTGVAAGLTLQPAHTYLFAISLGVFLSLDVLPKRSLTLSVHRHIAVALVLLAGSGAFAYFSAVMVNACTVSLIILGLRAAGAFLLAVWLVAGSSLMLKLLAEPETA
ncbi:phosphatase PAP2 family protein [Photobacterium sp. CAU 1568]|uniref:undecaprenyl-diphosphate phosphatase n=1 Tax=Photobacterium arenosum TaxID=2774143 RepID=A0ABR9BHX8_9GAMM|nr:phosphatase PAP2 family protein [Photobacterium arenosum]MBD8512158.1 phosphatase PAP2 family protein [Photobacterium arenosum]